MAGRVLPRTYAAPVAAPRTRSWLRGAASRFVARRLVIVGLVLVTVLVFLGLFGRFIAPYNPIKQDLQSVLAFPNAAHLLGTDELGRDILSRLLYGASISLQVGIGAVLIASIPGVALGMTVGYRGGALDNIVMRPRRLVLHGRSSARWHHVQPRTGGFCALLPPAIVLPSGITRPDVCVAAVAAVAGAS